MRDNCPACGSSTGLGEVICFKCGYRNSYNISGIFSEEVTNRTKQVLRVRSDIVLAPAKFSYKALEWLYKSCIYDEIISKQGIGYCTGIDKVFIPSFNGGQQLMFYQLRSLVDDDKNKYITYGSTASYTVKYVDHPESKTLLFCEDHLSAIRLRRFYNVVCLSGTSIKYSVIKGLLSEFDVFIFWLDPDQPGREALYKNLGRLKWNSGSSNVERMFLDKPIIEHKFYKVDYKKVLKDPKFYLDHEIQNIINTQAISI